MWENLPARDGIRALLETAGYARRRSAGGLEQMLVTQRMQALGDHAKGSRQPPLRPRQATNGDAITTAKQAIMRESAPKPPVVDDAAVKAVLNETGNRVVEAVRQN